MRVERMADLLPELREAALKQFAKLAELQRGVPEAMGGGGSYKINPGKVHATGLWLHATEHVGDLTHRMAQKHCERMHYGYEYVGRKVDVTLSAMRNPYGYAREIEENLRSNFNHLEEGKASGKSYETWIAEWKEAGLAYARAHKALTVWNPAQAHARDAAVAIGELRYEAAQHHLEELEARLNSPEDWTFYASTVCLTDEGYLSRFSRGVQENYISALETLIG